MFPKMARPLLDAVVSIGSLSGTLALYDHLYISGLSIQWRTASEGGSVMKMNPPTTIGVASPFSVVRQIGESIGVAVARHSRSNLVQWRIASPIESARVGQPLILLASGGANLFIAYSNIYELQRVAYLPGSANWSALM